MSVILVAITGFLVLYKICYKFNISQLILGLLLGMITSIPELITFVEAQKHYKGNKEEEFHGIHYRKLGSNRKVL